MSRSDLRQTHVYKTVAGHAIRADVYAPTTGRNRPGLLWVHGGGLILGNRGMIPAYQVQTYLEAGYCLVSIDFRLAPETRLEAIFEDVRDAYEWVRVQGPDRFGVDPGRIGIVGHSCGGYLALLGGVRLDPRPAVLVAFYGYGDINSAWITDESLYYRENFDIMSEEEARRCVGVSPISGSPFSPETFFKEPRTRYYVYCRQKGLWPRNVTGRSPDREPEWFRDHSPVEQVTKDYPPTILLHGEADTDVPFEKSLEMSRALQHHTVAQELVSRAEWPHAFDRIHDCTDAVIARSFRRVLGFLDAHLK